MSVTQPTSPSALQVDSAGGRKSRSFLFSAGALFGGNLLAMIMTIVGGILLGRLVTPSTLGLFTGIGLVLGYLPFLQLGILNGLNRELPYFVGRGDSQRVRELAAAAQAWALLVAGALFLALSGVATWEMARAEWWRAAGWFTNALLGASLIYGDLYLQVTYRTSHDFVRLAGINVAKSAVGLFLLVVVAALNFYGLCLRAVLAAVVGIILLHRWRPVPVKPAWSTQQVKHLLRIGAPIFIVGQAYNYWSVLDRTLVLALAGTVSMGLYAMVSMTTTAISMLPATISQIVYPRMAQHFGTNENVSGLVRMAWKPILVTVAATASLALAGWWAVGPLTRLVIPDYIEAVPALKWTLLLGLISSFGPMHNVFNVVRKQRLYLAAILIGMAAYGLSLALLVRGGVELTDFPQAMIIGRTTFTLLCYLFIWRLAKRSCATTDNDLP